MSRPRKPSNVLELNGAFKKNPQRQRTSEPKPTKALGDAPIILTEGEKEIWAELVEATPKGVLFDGDRFILEVAARLLYKLRVEGMLPAAYLGQLITCLGRLGLTPSDRSKVNVPSPEKKSEWDDI